MTRAEMVKEYVSRFPEPNQDKCIHVKLLWNGHAVKNGGDYSNLYDLRTGKKTIIPVQSDYSHWLNKNQSELQLRPKNPGYDSEIIATYVNYIPEYEMCEFGKIKIKATRPDKTKNKDIRKWEFSDYWDSNTTNWEKLRFFLFKDNAIAYDEAGEVFHPEDRGKFYNRKINKIFTSLLCPQGCFNPMMNCDELSTFVYGHDITTSGKKDGEANLYYTYWWAEWYRNIEKRPVSEAGKKAKSVVESLVLRDPSELAKQSPVILHKSNSTSGSYTYDDSYVEANYAFLDKKDDDYIITYHTRNITLDYAVKNSTLKSMKVGEVKNLNCGAFDAYPVYILINSKTGKPTIYQYDKKTTEYGITNAAASSIFYGGTPVIYSNLDNWDDCKPFKKALEIAKEALSLIHHDKEITRYSTLIHIINILRNPILFKMYDAGYVNLVVQSLQSFCPHAELNDVLGIEKNSKKATVEEFFGMTKEQLAYLNEQIGEKEKDRYGHITYKNSDIVRVMRHIKPMFSDMTTVNIADFKLFVNALKNICGSWRWYEEMAIISGGRYWAHILSDEEYQCIKDYIYLTRDNTPMANKLNAAFKMINTRLNADVKPTVHQLSELAKDEEEAELFLQKTRKNVEAFDDGRPEDIVW